MLKETFAERLKTAMDLQGKKQVDLIRIASQQGVKLGKKPYQSICKRKDPSQRRHSSFPGRNPPGGGRMVNGKRKSDKSDQGRKKNERI